MAIYGDNKHNYKTEVNKEEEKMNFIQIELKKLKENKNKLIQQLIREFRDDVYNWENYIMDLCEEALSKEHKKNLKTILYGE